MYGILLSAFNSILGWIFKQAVIKFVILFAVYWLVSVLVNNLSEFLGGKSSCCSIITSPISLSNLMSGLPTDIWYFLDLVNFTQGACLVFTAFVYRFLIRRIPLIG